MPAAKDDARPVEKTKVTEEKWGRDTMAQGFVVIPGLLTEFQRELDLDPIDFNILVQLIAHWWEPTGKVFPSKQRLADRMGISASTIQRHVKKLEDAGLVQREDRFGSDRQQMSNVYHLGGLVKRLADLSSELRAAKAEQAATDAATVARATKAVRRRRS